MRFLSATLLSAATLALADEPVIQRMADVPYGDHALQRMDVYLPKPTPTNAPIVVMVHGGGWTDGDKSNREVFFNKANRWIARGWVLVAINNRLVPDADPVVQAEDVVRALIAIQNRARDWGGDPAKVILMGHSAGGHLVALVSGNPELAKKQGIKPWLGTVVLDSSALDVPEIMESRHLPLYDKAFGADKDFWKRSSPLHALTAQATPMFLVCSLQRLGPCGQAQAFSRAAKHFGVRAEVHEANLNHREINETLGVDGDYTRRVEAFMASLDPAFK